jgi:hypothetical protein
MLVSFLIINWKKWHDQQNKQATKVKALLEEAEG